MKNHYLLSLLFASALAFTELPAQCVNQVTHTSDTAIVANSSVSVTSTGCVSVNSVYCASTVPYFIGYNGSSCTGSYTFNFSPAVSGVTLNFSGLSNDPTNNEIVVLMVNNAHYAIPSPGTANACDPLAVLTPNGDVGACNNCGVSGWNGTTIPGPITTLTVIDSVLMGAPAGSIFSLFICPPDPNTVGDLNGGISFGLYPNPAADQINLMGIQAATPYMITDVTGNVVLNGIANDKPIDVSSLAPGVYFVLAEDRPGIRFIKD